MSAIARWTDLDWALWLLAEACGRADEADARALALLALHRERLLVLNAEWVAASPHDRHMP